MAVAKRRQPETPKERAIADRVRRAKFAPIAERWFEWSGELAQKLGMQASDVLDMFDELASIHVYKGMPREAAEEKAWEQTVDILKPRGQR